MNATNRADRGSPFLRASIWWIAAALPPLVVYARTMAPGLLAQGDTPKFQFLGVVLGTAHSPGYPLFVWLSWLMSHLPFRTVAWRVNLLTMIFGVSAAALTSRVARAAGANGPAALLAGLGLAFGPIFWAQATAAEVYTLAATLLAGTMLLVLRWQRTRRDRDLIGASALAALALGHHPTFMMCLPAIVAFVLLTDWRLMRRPGLLCAIGALAIAGLAQYLFIVARTHQGAAYIEAHAEHVSDLLSVLRGDQYSHSLFAFGWRDFVRDRVPLISSLVASELGLPAIALALAGVIALARHNWRALVLFLGAGAATFIFTASYRVPDYDVFAISTYQMAWILAAIGLSGVMHLWKLDARPQAMLSGAVVVLLVSIAVVRSYDAEDLSAATDDMEYFQALVTQVPKPATVYSLNADPASHAIRYEMLAEHRGTPGIRVAEADESLNPAAALRGRRGTYSFESGRATLEARGVVFGLVNLPAPVAPRLARAPRGTTVAVALGPDAAASLDADVVLFLRRAGLTKIESPLAAVARDGVVVSESGPSGGRATGTVGPAATPLVADASATGADVRLGGRVLDERNTGLVAAAVDSDGRLLWTLVVDRPDGVGPVFDTRFLYRAAGGAPCHDAAPGQWVTFAAPELIGFNISVWFHSRRSDLPAGTSLPLTAYAVTDQGSPRFAVLGPDKPESFPESQIFDSNRPGGRTSLEAQLSADQLALGESGTIARATDHLVTDASVEAHGTIVTVPHPRAVAVTLDGPSSASVRFCAMPVNGLDLFVDPSETRVELVRNHTEFVGDGWGGDPDEGDDRVRLTVADRADERFTLARPLPLEVSVEAQPSSTRQGAQIGLIVNGVALERQPLTAGDAVYRWTVPPTAVRAGYNTMTLVGPPDPPPAGSTTNPAAVRLAVRSFALETVRR